MGNLHFSTNAKMEKLVGRELITNTSIAIFELVKNSYDAGATKVTISFRNFLQNNLNKISDDKSFIIIEDNGKGMSLEEVKKYWMELGTPYKENIKKIQRSRSSEISYISRRMINGEKGIGRFGVDKIGAKLKLQAIDSSGKERTTVNFEWDQFDDTSKKIEEIPCTYEYEKLESKMKSGLKLEMRELRDEWTVATLKSLKRDLSKFLSPIPLEKDDFKIYFEFEYRDGNLKMFSEKEEIKNDSFDFLESYIDLELSDDGLLKETIIFNKEVYVNTTKQVYEKGTSFGGLKSRIYYLERGEKIKFSNMMGLTTREYGNIRIFRGNFRVMPYGDIHNDWLEIDNRHAQGLFRTFGTRDLVGYILLSQEAKSKNWALREATDRVGFIEDDTTFKELREFMKLVLEDFEKQFFGKLKKKTKTTREILDKENKVLKNEIKTFSTGLKETLEIAGINDENIKGILDSSKAIEKKVHSVEKASSEATKTIKVYEKLLEREGFVVKIMHEIKNKLVFIKSQAELLKVLNIGEPINSEALFENVKRVDDLVTAGLTSVKLEENKKEIISISDIIQKSEIVFRHLLEKNNIELSIKDNLPRRNKEVHGDFENLIKVFDNLFSNSIKALNDSEYKIIEIEVTRKNNRINVLFSDTGNGIPEDKIAFIFSLWSSFQENHGTGIGLSLAKEILEDHDGEIDCIEAKEGFSTSFLIDIPAKLN